MNKLDIVSHVTVISFISQPYFEYIILIINLLFWFRRKIYLN